MSEKTICFINSTKSWGGGEKWHFDIATRLFDKGYHVIVITNKESELFKRIKAYGIKTYEVKIHNLSFFNPFKVLKIKKILKKENVSTTIMNLPADLKVASFAAKRARVKKVIYRRGSAIPIKNKLINRIIFKNFVDEIIANSLETKNTILSKNPHLFDSNKIKVIYNGIDISAKETENDKIVYAKKDDEIIIGNAGRFAKQKNHGFLIELAKELKKQKLNFKVLLAGEGKLEEEIKTLCQKADVADRVIFTGFVKNIEEFMNSIDIYVLPSLWEGFGYVLVEAMFYKKPIVAFDLSSNPEIIKDKETGFLVKEGDLSAFTDKVLLLSGNKNLREEIGLNGRQRVNTYFSIEKTIQLVEDTLK